MYQKWVWCRLCRSFPSFPFLLSALGYSHHLLKCIILTVYYSLLFCVFMAEIFTCELDVVPDTEDNEKNNKMRMSCNSVLNAGTLSVKSATKCLRTSHYGPPWSPTYSGSVVRLDPTRFNQQINYFARASQFLHCFAFTAQLLCIKI